MANGASSSSPKFGLVIVALLVGLGIGYAVGHSSGERDGQEAGRLLGNAEGVKIGFAEGLAGANVVYIGPSAKTATPDELPIYINKKSVVYWKPWTLGGGHRVAITFLAGHFPAEAEGQPPFENGNPNTDQVIRCDGETCFSYAINPALKAYFDKNPKGTLIYPYEQKLDDQSPVDGHIVIKQWP